MDGEGEEVKGNSRLLEEVSESTIASLGAIKYLEGLNAVESDRERLVETIKTYLASKQKVKATVDDAEVSLTEFAHAVFYTDDPLTNPFQLSRRLAELDEHTSEMDKTTEGVIMDLERVRRDLSSAGNAISKEASSRLDELVKAFETKLTGKCNQLQSNMDILLERERASEALIEEQRKEIYRQSRKLESMGRTLNNSEEMFAHLFTLPKPDIKKGAQRFAALNADTFVEFLRWFTKTDGTESIPTAKSASQKREEKGADHAANAKIARLERELKEKELLWKKAVEDAVKLRRLLKINGTGEAPRASFVEENVAILQKISQLGHQQDAGVVVDALDNDKESQTAKSLYGNWEEGSEVSLPEDESEWDSVRLPEKALSRSESFKPAAVTRSGKKRRKSKSKRYSVSSSRAGEEEDEDDDDRSLWDPRDDQSKQLGVLRFLIHRFSYKGMKVLTTYPTQLKDGSIQCPIAEEGIDELMSFEHLEEAVPGLKAVHYEANLLQNILTSMKAQYKEFHKSVAKLSSQLKHFQALEREFTTLTETVKDMRLKANEVSKAVRSVESQHLAKYGRLEKIVYRLTTLFQNYVDTNLRSSYSVRVQQSLSEIELYHIRPVDKMKIGRFLQTEVRLRKSNAINNWALLFVKVQFFQFLSDGILNINDLPSSFGGDRVVLMRHLSQKKWESKKREILQGRQKNLERLYRVIEDGRAQSEENPMDFPMTQSVDFGSEQREMTPTTAPSLSSNQQLGSFLSDLDSDRPRPARELKTFRESIMRSASSSLPTIQRKQSMRK